MAGERAGPRRTRPAEQRTAHVHDFSHSKERVQMHNQYFFRRVRTAWDKEWLFKKIFGAESSTNAIKNLVATDNLAGQGERGLHLLVKGHSWWSKVSNKLTLYEYTYRVGASTPKLNMHEELHRDVQKDMSQAGMYYINLGSQYTEEHPYLQNEWFFGDKAPRYVIRSTSTSNVFFFWSGHGGSKEGPLWGNEDAQTYFGSERISNLVSQMQATGLYRRMMFAVETCFSGQWGLALTGQPDVAVLTAANPRETSKADVYDTDMGVFLSNAFARTFRQQVNQNHRISLRDLYIELARTTNGSHVSIYNEQNYGSVYTNDMSDFFPR